MRPPDYFLFFFFNDTATTEIYTLSLHDALPIFVRPQRVENRAETAVEPFEIGGVAGDVVPVAVQHVEVDQVREQDRKSTRLNSSHSQISYAVFCLKKKK